MPETQARLRKLIRDIVTAKLKKSQELTELGADVFYVKNLNIHRCVVNADVSGKPGISPEIIRNLVLKYHPASWFRGMGFGVVLRVNSVTDVSSAYEAAVDIRNQRRGTWQWTILHSSTERTCAGYHTWTRGVTTPVFQNILRLFKTHQYRVSDRKVQMDRLLNFATKWSLHGRLMPQYVEIFPK